MTTTKSQSGFASFMANDVISGLLMAVPFSMAFMSLAAVFEFRPMGLMIPKHYAIYFAAVYLASIVYAAGHVRPGVMTYTIGSMILALAMVVRLALIVLGIPVAIVAFFMATTNGIGFDNVPFMCLLWMALISAPAWIRP